MTNVADLRLKNPPHPGVFVQAEVIRRLNLSVTESAEVLGITRAALSTFLHGRSNLSPEMALRIEKAFGISMDTLMRMQCSYDIAQARARAGEINVARYAPKPKTGIQPGLFEG
jgi:addiction module HigA family antidote